MAKRRQSRPYTSADEPQGYGGARRDPYGRERRGPEMPDERSLWRRLRAFVRKKLKRR
jgi:hypothetical protein